MAQCQSTPAPAGDSAPARAHRVTTLRWALLALVAAAVILILATGVWRHISLAELRERRAELQAFVRRHPVLSLEVYAAAYAVMIALSIPGALVMSLGGGYLFGALLGGATAIVGETAGAIAMFLAARSAFGASFAGRFLKKGGVGDRVLCAVEESPFTGLLMLRLIPAMPFSLVNLAAAMTRAPLGPYVAATILGITPSTFVYAWIGQGLGVALNRNGVPKVSTLVNPGVYLPLAALAALGGGVFLLQVRHKRRLAASGATP